MKIKKIVEFKDYYKYDWFFNWKMLKYINIKYRIFWYYLVIWKKNLKIHSFNLKY